VEPAAVDVDWIIFMGSAIGGLRPYQHEPGSGEKRQQLRERVGESLGFLKIKYHLSD
jgi:hypothetical protein